MRGASQRTAAAALIAASLAVASLLLGLSACVLDVPYDKFAIVYGVADYGGLLSTLLYTDEDADAMQQLFSDSQGFAEVILRKNNLATSGQLLIDIGDIAANPDMDQDDLFVFYFSGHGGPYGTGPEAQGGDAQDEWISLYGSDATPELSTTFSDDALIAALRVIPCRKKVFIIDACNSGGFIGNELEADGEPPSLADGSESIVALAARAIRLYANFDGSSADIPPWEALVLSAAGERESSWESSFYGHGVFTFYLLKAESKGDLNHDGWVTVTEAFAYTQKKIYEDWNYGDGFPFSPHVSGGPVDYVLFEAR
jgi:hypothetical protein